MKFYINSELEATLKNEDALNRCKKCVQCFENYDGTHFCNHFKEVKTLEGELENEDDDHQMECWL